MTVTKAAAAAGANGSQRPRFEFDAQDNDSDEEQSSDRVMVQGFQTLATSTVTKVGEQDGVADAVGGLSLQVIKVGRPVQARPVPAGRGRRGPAAGRPGGGGQAARQPAGRGSRAAAPTFDVNNYSVYGTDVTEPGPRPADLLEDHQRPYVQDVRDQRRRSSSPTSRTPRRRSSTVGDTVTINSVKYKVIGIATPDSGDAAANLYIPLKQAQTLGDSKDKVTTIYVKARDSQQIDSVKAAIQKNISGTTVTTSADLADTVSGSLSTASDLASNVGKWLSIAVLVAAFLVAGLLTSSAVCRRVREFGTLKALGWKRAG